MKIYTKILIGMAIGAIIGLTLGPKSGLLEHDSYQVAKASQVKLLLDKDDPASEIKIPKDLPLSLRTLETVYKDMPDGSGGLQTLPAFVRVKFKYSKKMSLADRDGELGESLGGARAGDTIEAWLVVEQRLLASPSQVFLQSSEEDSENVFQLSGEQRLSLNSLDTVMGPDGKTPRLLHVNFTFSKKMLGADTGGLVATSLGGAKAGDTVDAWVVVDRSKFDTLVIPEPVSSLGTTIITWIKPIGQLFMRLIKMVIVPLVFCSLLVGVAGLGDVRKLGRLGGRTLALYMLTTAGAVSIGLMMANLIKPGNFVAEKDKAALVAQFESMAGDKTEAAANAPSAIDNILNIIPNNPVESLASGNMLQIIFFAFLFGIALTMLEKSRSQQVITLLDTIQHAMILIIHMVMAVAPFGVAALIAEVVGQSGYSILSALAIYAITVVLGLLCLGVFIYGGLVRFVAKLPFISFLKAARPAQLIAFSTSSSSAALPITLECAEENLGISKSVSSFVIPLGSTVNMDGTALYQGVAAIFIAQVFGIDLTLGDQLGIVLAATAASIGAAGVPGAGMITLAAVLTTAGIPAVGVALILGVDRILDMFRTAINVTGDLAVTTVMAVMEGEKISLLSTDDDLKDKTKGFEGRIDREQRKVDPDGEAERDE